MAETLTIINESACFGGNVAFYQHHSDACNCTMRFAVYLPPQAQNEAVPVLYYLSGLTCTEENFMIKAGAQRYAAELGVMLVAPDTSPRGAGVADDDAYDLGMGAGFYVDATESPWNQHYKMYTYVTEELPDLIRQQFFIGGDRAGIFGHSMGGHGALVCGLRNPNRYCSISAFAPISAPMQCPWGEKAFSNYLGSDQSHWKAYDASELVLTHADPSRPILIDQGLADTYLQQQLLPQIFEAACEKAGQPVMVRMRSGYDHGYYFISTFMADHMRHHADALYSQF